MRSGGPSLYRAFFRGCAGIQTAPVFWVRVFLHKGGNVFTQDQSARLQESKGCPFQGQRVSEVQIFFLPQRSRRMILTAAISSASFVRSRGVLTRVTFLQKTLLRSLWIRTRSRAETRPRSFWQRHRRSRRPWSKQIIPKAIPGVHDE